MEGGYQEFQRRQSQFFESYNFLFHSFLRLFRTYMLMRAKREVHLSRRGSRGGIWGFIPQFFGSENYKNCKEKY